MMICDSKMFLLVFLLVGVSCNPVVVKSNVMLDVVMSECNNLVKNYNETGLEYFKKNVIPTECQKWSNFENVNMTKTMKIRCTLYKTAFTTFCAEYPIETKNLSSIFPESYNGNISEVCLNLSALPASRKIVKNYETCVVICNIFTNEGLSLSDLCKKAFYYFNFKFETTPALLNVASDDHLENKPGHDEKPDFDIESQDKATVALNEKIPALKTPLSASKNAPDQAEHVPTLIAKTPAQNAPENVPKAPLETLVPEKVPQVSNEDNNNKELQKTEPEAQKPIEQSSVGDTIKNMAPSGEAGVKTEPEGDIDVKLDETNQNDDFKIPPSNQGAGDEPVEPDYSNEGIPPQDKTPVKELPTAQEDKVKESDASRLGEPYSYDDADLDGNSSFFAYFAFICIVSVIGYVGYHNKQKILALMLEGRSSRRTQRGAGGVGGSGRRPNSANYHKLDTNLEEAISSSCNKTSSHIIY